MIKTGTVVEPLRVQLWNPPKNSDDSDSGIWVTWLTHTEDVRLAWLTLDFDFVFMTSDLTLSWDGWLENTWIFKEFKIIILVFLNVLCVKTQLAAAVLEAVRPRFIQFGRNNVDDAQNNRTEVWNVCSSNLATQPPHDKTQKRNVRAFIVTELKMETG